MNAPAATRSFWTAFGPGLLGVLRDVSGSYGVPLAVCMGLNLMASALILMRSRRPA